MFINSSIVKGYPFGFYLVWMHMAPSGYPCPVKMNSWIAFSVLNHYSIIDLIWYLSQS